MAVSSFPPRGVRAEGWSVLSPRCVGAAARRTPAYLLSTVMLLYLAGQCAFLCTRSPPWISGTRRGFFPSSYDSGPVSSDCLQIRERSSGPELFARKSIFRPFLWRYLSSPSPASKTFMFFGCGWWYDREIVLLPPLCEYRERL